MPSFSAERLKGWVEDTLEEAEVADRDLSSLVRECLEFDDEMRIYKESLVKHKFFDVMNQ